MTTYPGSEAPVRTEQGAEKQKCERFPPVDLDCWGVEKGAKRAKCVRQSELFRISHNRSRLGCRGPP